MAALPEGKAESLSPEANAMLDACGRFEDAYFNQDAEGLMDTLAPDAVLHADRLTIEKECVGRQEIARHFRKYFANYKFKHFPLVRAVNEKNRSVFCLWDDEEVIMRPERYDESLPASGNATTVAGIWKLVLDEQNRIKDIWFLRQFTSEEKKYRLKYHPNQLYVDFQAKHYVGPTLDLTDKQVAAMADAAARFNEVWQSGNVQAVHDVMAPDAHTINPIFGDKKASREEWEHMISDVFEFWEVESNDVDIAVTPASNKAFLHWHVRGRQKLPSSPRRGAPPAEVQANDMYGLNVLVFDVKEGHISEVVGFRQPLRSEHDHIFKAGPYLDTLPED